MLVGLAAGAAASAGFAWWWYMVPSQPQALELVSAEGEVRVNGEQAEPGPIGNAPGTEISAGANGFATLRQSDGTVTQLTPNSRIAVAEALASRNARRYRTTLRLDAGEILREVPPPQEGVSRVSDVLTRATNVGVRGTAYVVRSQGDVGYVMVHRGEVALAGGPGDPTRLGENYGTVARAGQKPEPPSVLLPPPALVAPQPSQRLAASAIRFEWAPVPSAQAYLLEIGRDPQFRDMVLRQRTVETAYTLDSPLPYDARHYWRVASVDARDLLGRGGEPRALHYKHFHDAGRAAVERGDARTGLALYRQAERGYHDDAPLLKDIGWAYYVAGELPQAREYLDRSLARDGSDLEARIRRGRVLYWLKDYAAARADYEKVLSVTPRDADALWGLAEVEMAEGRPRVALTLLDKAIAQHPEHAYALVTAAKAWLEVGDKDRARDLLARELKLRPGNAAAAGLYESLRRKPARAGAR
jgi:tetratricopeptide (TPR) repeat protein